LPWPRRGRLAALSTAPPDDDAERDKRRRGDGSPPRRPSPRPVEARCPSLSHVAALAKARLSALVVGTTAAGFVAAGPAALAAVSIPTLVSAAAGTALCAGSAATFNQVLEVERDGRMKRTGQRPLVTGAVSKEAAAGVGGLLGAAGAVVLGLGTDPVTTALGIGNIGLYAGLYTYLKPRSEINTWVGAVVGAIPPVMGWTAAGGSVMDAEAVLMGSTLFLWQFPHFFALNWMHRADYARGGFRMVAVNDPAGDRTARLITRYTQYLASLPFLSTALGVTSPMFAVDGGLLLSGYALRVAYKFDRERSNANARRVFLTSLWYLPCALTLFLLHSRRWHEEAADDDRLREDASLLVRARDVVRDLRSRGRDLCAHEALAAADVGVRVGDEARATPVDETACPVALARAAAGSAGAAIVAGGERLARQGSGARGSTDKRDARA